jgi:hypothetical protein
MFAGQIPLAEKILRTVIVYGLLCCSGSPESKGWRA